MAQNIVSLAPGVQGVFIKNDRFNTTRISFNFYLPLSADSVAENALLPFILTTCSKKYPDFSKLNFKLSKLYGANLSAAAEKLGDFQLLQMGISVIEDRFTLDGEDLGDQACRLLTDMIFEPKVENGAFCTEDLEREKRKAIEHIRGELNDKRAYAQNRMIEEMFKGEPYGLPKCGTEQDVNAITGESLYNAWQRMLESGFLRVTVVSGSMPEGLFEGISERFCRINRQNITEPSANCPAASISQVNTVTEHMDITQGKLVMGFTTDLYGSDDTTLPLLVASDIFGGGPYSRLFSNVREKMSLCYYCFAAAKRIKGILVVSSGVEAENAQKAKQAILEQLEVVKNGEFTDFEFESSIKNLVDSMKSYDDSQSAINAWYSNKIMNKKLKTPEEVVEALLSVDRRAVTEAAKNIKLHTVYCLLPEGGKE